MQMQQNQTHNPHPLINIEPNDIKIEVQKIDSKTDIVNISNHQKIKRKYSQSQIQQQPQKNQFLTQNQDHFSTDINYISVQQPDKNKPIFDLQQNEDILLSSSQRSQNQFLQSKFKLKSSSIKKVQRKQSPELPTQQAYKQIREYRKDKILQNSHLEQNLKQKAKIFVTRMRRSKQQVLGRIAMQKQIQQSKRRQHQQSLQKQKEQKKQLQRMRRKIKTQQKIYYFKQKFQERQKQLQKSKIFQHRRSETQAASSQAVDQNQLVQSYNKQSDRYRQLKSSLQLPQLKRMTTQVLNQQTFPRMKYKSSFRQQNNDQTLNNKRNSYLQNNLNLQLQSPAYSNSKRRQSIVSPLSREGRHEIGNKYMIQKRSFSSTNQDCFSIDQKQKIKEIRRKIKQLNQMSRNM